MKEISLVLVAPVVIRTREFFYKKDQVPKRGLEPPFPRGNTLLKRARLPFRHFGLSGLL